MLLLNLLLFSILISFVVAKFEINVEGKDGWAKNLPTWRKNNQITRLFFGDYDLTGYHFWFFIMSLTFLHFPYFVGLIFSWSLELKIMAVFFLGVALEDFLWFVLNPSFGIKKFNKNSGVWLKWVGFIPVIDLTYLVILALLIFLSNII